MTQKDMVISHLLEHGSITSLDAIQEYGITRLADVIYKLKKDKWPIITLDEVSKNRYGKEVRYGRYILPQK